MARGYESIVVIGGGIVGCATALKLLESRACNALVLVEKEPALAAHQTGHNSGVIHSGLYYKPGSLKAKTCAEGRVLLERFAVEHEIPFERSGKIVVATHADEIQALAELERRGRANGLSGVRRIAVEEVREREPHAAGVAALLVPETGVIDYARVTRAIAGDVERLGGDVRTGAAAIAIARDGRDVVVTTTRGEVRARYLVNCAGLQSDRVARMAGARSSSRIVPFRGEYYALTRERASLVKHLIYPVPNPAFPFLGVHFTRRIGGEVEAGPNAVLALAREGYTKTRVSAKDAWSSLSFPGFWKMARRYWRTGLDEMVRSWKKEAFVRALQRLVPEVGARDLVPAGAGVRAQALDPSGALVDDFLFIQDAHALHVLNAPSPAATASLAIGAQIARQVEESV